MLEMIAKRNAKRAAERDEKEKENARERIVAEVAKWARDKNIKAMLNEVNGVRSPDKTALKRYPRAIIIHLQLHLSIYLSMYMHCMPTSSFLDHYLDIVRQH
jgi:hypothetical protein